VRLLTLYPRLGRRQSMPGIRKIVTARYLFIICYEIDVTGGWLNVLTAQYPA